MHTPPIVIAELSANHNNNLDIALKSVEAVAASGANAIKLQTYKPSCLTLPSRTEVFRIKDGLWKDKYLWDLYEEASLPWEWHGEIFNLARSKGLEVFSSPFSPEGVEFLERLDCPMYKVASFEVMHLPLLKAIAATKKPVILSLGVASDEEIEKALEILESAPKKSLLYCISSYPADLSEARLCELWRLRDKWGAYGVDIGLSDHTKGITVPLVATLCGVSIIEKHFILDRSLGGVDSTFSLDKGELEALVKGVKEVCVLRDSLGGLSLPGFLESKNEDGGVKKGREFSRSLFVSKAVKKGEVISQSCIACVRPNAGLSPLLLDSIVGQTFSCDLEAYTPLKAHHIE